MRRLLYILESRAVLEANFDKDKEYRNRAVDFANSLISFVEKHPDLFTEKNGNFITDTSLFWKDPAARGLYVILTPAKGVVKGGLGKAGSRDVVLLPFLKQAGDLTDVGSRMGMHQNVIVHEIIHWLDPGMRKGPKADTTSSAYYNNPSEWNAFWQEGVSKVERSIDSMADRFREPEQRKKIIAVLFGGGTFDGFQKKLETYWDKEFLNGMNGEIRRKFDKRLYQLWIQIKDRVQ